MLVGVATFVVMPLLYVVGLFVMRVFVYGC
jgi:hypothetical protein